MRRTTLCGAAPPYSLDIRFGGSGTAYSKAAHIPVRRAGATPLSLKVHPLCLQYAELPLPFYFQSFQTTAVTGYEEICQLLGDFLTVSLKANLN